MPIEVEKGQTYGSWTVLEPLVIIPRTNRYPRRMAKVECSCGHKKLVALTDLLDGSSKSCRRHNGAHQGPNDE